MRRFKKRKANAVSPLPRKAYTTLLLLLLLLPLLSLKEYAEGYVTARLHKQVRAALLLLLVLLLLTIA